MGREDVRLWIDPPSYHFDQDRLFDSSGAWWSGESILSPWTHLRGWFNARGVEVHTADLLDSAESGAGTNVYVSWSRPRRHRGIASRQDVTASAFFAVECPIVAPQIYKELSRITASFRRVFSFTGAAALEPFLEEPLDRDLQWCPFPHPLDQIPEHLWSRRDREFLVMINANKRSRARVGESYTERLRAVKYFADLEEIDLYGIGWDGPPFPIGGDSRLPGTVQRAAFEARRVKDRLRPDPLLKAARTVWRGSTASKLETLSRYRFAICFENMILDGWITEKIFDCLFAGTIPVYLGAPDVTDRVPAECFVDVRRFDGYASLREYIRSLGSDDIESYREAGRSFVSSSGFEPFTKHALTNRIAAIVEEDTGRVLRDGPTGVPSQPDRAGATRAVGGGSSA